MKLPLILFFVILATIIFFKWRQNLPEKEFKKEQKKEDDKEKELKPGEIIKISATGAIFLVLLYALVPEFIVKNHKEIIILVVAMVTGAVLGVKQDWEKSSTRKILRAHYIALTIILVLVVIYNDSKTRKWLKNLQLAQPRAAVDYPLCAGPIRYEGFKKGAVQIKVPLNPRCWSGFVIMPNYKFKFRFSSPGELEFKFIEGGRVLFAPTDPPALIGDIGRSYFQLRGDGEAIITVEKI